jgi:hypothetical protein
MIKQLYIEKLPNGNYNVICDGLMIADQHVDNIGAAIEVFYAEALDDVDSGDDVAGVRVGYMGEDTYRLYFNGEWCNAFDYNLERRLALMQWLSEVQS